MGAGDEGDAPVEDVPHGHLLAGRLGVDVDDDGVDGGADAVILQRLFRRRKRVVERIHEQPPHHLHHHHPAAAGGGINVGAETGRPLRIVERTEQARVFGDVADGLPPVPDVVAGGDGVGAGLVERPADLLGDAEAVGGVLAVDEDEIEAEALSQLGQPLAHDVAAGAADDIAAIK